MVDAIYTANFGSCKMDFKDELPGLKENEICHCPTR